MTRLGRRRNKESTLTNGDDLMNSESAFFDVGVGNY